MFQQRHCRHYVRVFLWAFIGLFGGVDQTWALSFVYVANNGGGVSAYTIAAGTGALTPVPGSPFATGTNPGAIIASADLAPASTPATASIPALSAIGCIMLALMIAAAVQRRRHSVNGRDRLD